MAGSGGSHRRHLRPGRPHKVLARFSVEEWGKLVEAAERAGITTTSFVAESAVRAADGGSLGDVVEYRQALLELQAARTEVRRVGVLLNQAVAAGHVAGAPARSVERFAAQADQVVGRLDDLAVRVVRGLP